MRVDYFLLWPIFPMERWEDTLKIMRRFEILEIFKVPFSKKLVKVAYKYNYVPIRHLKSKTRYFKGFTGDCWVIFVRNHPDIVKIWKGQEACRNIIETKAEIRKWDEAAYEHIVHGSDNEKQTRAMMKFLGFKKDYFDTDNLLFPHYLKEPNPLEIRNVHIDLLKCRINGAGIVPLDQAPHMNDEELKEYEDKYRGTKLRQDYRGMRPACDQAIIAVDRDYVILDGVHRACAYKKEGREWISIVLM